MANPLIHESLASLVVFKNLLPGMMVIFDRPKTAIYWSELAGEKKSSSSPAKQHGYFRWMPAEVPLVLDLSVEPI
jgi:hypothetical protein